MRNKRLINNRKGFTLVELLGVIVIIGVMMGIAIPTISFIVNKTREKYYTEQTQLMVEAAQSYFNDNPNEKPKEIGQSKTISLQYLYNEKYIKEKIIDKTGNTCYYNSTDTKIKNSYVKIYKYNKTDYSYEGYLNCPACEGDRCKTIEEGKKPNITISFDVDKSDLTTGNIILKIEGNESNLSSYSYKIFANGVLAYNSGVKLTDQSTLNDLTIPIAEYLPSKIKIIVTATNSKGITATQSSVNDLSNLVAVQIGNKSFTPPLVNSDKCSTSDWIKEGSGSRTVSVECISNKGTGCAQSIFTNTYNKSSKYPDGSELLPMQDSKGKTFNAKVYTCIDGTYPEIKFSLYKKDSKGDKVDSSDWHKTNIYVLAEVSDEQSNVSSIKWEENASNNFTKNTNTKVVSPAIKKDSKGFIISASNTLTGDGIRYVKVTVTDNVGNTTTKDITVKIDKTAPVCGSFSGGSTSWTNSSRTISVDCSDSGIGCAQSSFSKTVTTAGSTSKVSIDIEDKAGNSTTCSNTVNLYIDKTAPTCGSWKDDGGNIDTGYRTLSVGCSDSNSGCVSSTNSTSILNSSSNVSISIKDNAGNSTTCNKTVTPIKTVTISYDGNSPGGTVSGVPSKQTVSPGASTTITSSTPSNSSYVFLGWNTNSSGTGTWYDPGTSINISSNINLYAQWYDVASLEKKIYGSVHAGDFKLKSFTTLSSASTGAFSYNSSSSSISADSGYQKISNGYPAWKSNDSGFSVYKAVNGAFAWRNVSKDSRSSSKTASILEVKVRTGSAKSGTLDSRILGLQNEIKGCLSYAASDGDIKVKSTSQTLTCKSLSDDSGSISADSGYTGVCLAGWDLDGTGISFTKIINVSGSGLRLNNGHNSNTYKPTLTLYLLETKNKSVGTATSPSYGSYSSKGQKYLEALKSLSSQTSKLFNYSNTGGDTVTIAQPSSGTSRSGSVSSHTRVVCPTGFRFENASGGSGESYANILAMRSSGNTVYIQNTGVYRSSTKDSYTDSVKKVNCTVHVFVIDK